MQESWISTKNCHSDIQAGKVVSAYALDRHGIAAAVSKMAFGNALGVKIEHNLDPRDFFAPGFGDIIMEVPADKVGELSITYTLIGEVTEDGKFSYGDAVIHRSRGSRSMERNSGKSIQDCLRRNQ